MYQAKRSKKLIDTLQLVDKYGKVVHELEIEVDIDAISEGFRNTLVLLRDAEKRLTESQKKGDPEAFGKAYEDYGKILVTMFSMTFGAENTQTIFDFYEGKYTEMSVEMVPYIIETIIPKVGSLIKERKNRLKKAGKRKWHR